MPTPPLADAHQDERAVRAILFDLDGTLVDSFGPIRDSVNHVRATHGLPPITLETVKACVGNGLVRLLELTVPDGEPRRNAAQFTQHHETVLAAGTRMLPDVRATLEALSARGIKLGLCSNKPLALSQKVLSVLGLDSIFSIVLGPESVPNRKPAPDMLLCAAKLLGESPARMLYVGDMSLDVQTARAAGVPVWVAPSGCESAENLAEARPDRVLAHFAELLDILPNHGPGATNRGVRSEGA